MLIASGNSFTKQFSNSTAPSLTPGTSITPGNNTFPAYAEILSDTVVTEDAYGIMIWVANNAFTAAGRDTLLNIGADPAGTTSFVTIIPNLLVSCAGSITPATNGGGGVFYYFPLWIRAGTSLAAQASVNNATVQTFAVVVTLVAGPTHPELLRCGSYVTALGAVTATSRGTTVTPGTSAAEGAYVSLGTPTLPHWWWQCGYGIQDTTMNNGMIMADIGAGASGSQELLIENDIFIVGAGETINKPLTPRTYNRDVAGSVEIWGRASNSLAANDSANSIMAYGMG